MPPSIYFVRHAEAEHNVSRDPNTRDARLTQRGKAQCAKLLETFPAHDSIDLIVASPLRRTIQTAVLCFRPSLAKENVEFHLLPEAQEVSDMTCNVGFPQGELEIEVQKLFGDDESAALASRKINYAAVVEGWNSKQGTWGSEKSAVEARAATLRAWLYARPEKSIVVVTHGNFLRYLTDDWNEPIYSPGNQATAKVAALGLVPPRGTSWANCEIHQFEFSPDSNENDAHLLETDASKNARKSFTP
ncbi:putative phosphatase [Lachnellula hyalina]|uniref:Putative phosphatase n=1 Tax=Lachnellula hyalina TaxID=1316788 RepID=A0A8H8U3S5_9HELO|nr:putative phosphatase [Lachnellula hyalina]TVY30324.1 putative phosphatase [Lachnellula hyalina]